MPSGCFRFENFVIDPAGRRLLDEGEPVELSARYFDALVLLVRQSGELITKDRFLEEVWDGIPVTDEALTQCVRSLRKALGDKAANPRFIETVPKHGYRFIAPVESVENTGARATRSAARLEAQTKAGGRWRRLLLLGGAGTLGAGVAGIVGGLFYGFAGAAQPGTSEMGAASVVLVLLWLTIFAALTGGAGIGFGIAAAGAASGRSWRWSWLGGAVGGLAMGGIAKLFGFDAFNLLFGRAPGDITGAFEGALLGGTVGFGGWIANRSGPSSPRRAAAYAALAACAGGVLIAALGGRMMGGSLDLLAQQFTDSRLSLDALGALSGEAGFGPVAHIVTGGIEGLLFGGCVVAAMMLADRRLNQSSGVPAFPRSQPDDTEQRNIRETTV